MNHSKLKIQFSFYVILIFCSITSRISAQQAEPNRIYLNFLNANQNITQSLISYHAQATNGYDFGIDSELFNYPGTALYSLIDGSESYYVIQARALPFVNTDKVSLGIRIINAGNYTIALGTTQGIFAGNMPIYIKDKLNKVIFNLRNGSFTFYSVAGTFNDRFELVYLEGKSIWTGSEWDYGTPHPQKDVLINGILTINEDYANEFGEAEFGNVTVSENGSLTIDSGYSMTINGRIIQNNSAPNFLVKHEANLIQTQEGINLGEITVRRTAQIKHLDYTIWSSPVAGQVLQAFSPYTLPNRIRTYNGAPEVNTWVITTGNFEAGKGYMFRAPNVFDTPYPSAYSWTGTFVGVPHNHDVIATFVNTGNFQSVGNPYPSNIDRATFHQENPNIGALYFWTNSFGTDANGNYLGNNWKLVNILGESVSPTDGGNEPMDYIAVGQGFLARTYNNESQVVFNNEMRTTNNAVFYKTASTENHKYWLNLQQENQSLNQMFVSYNASSSNDLDLGIDASLFNYSGSAIYSLIENSDEKFAIQGRALPFTQYDIVPLGFKATQAGSYTISLSNVDGLFAEGQNIYLRDKFTQIEHDLKTSNYDFVSDPGTFNERFEVIYTTQSLSVSNPNLENSWIVYKNDNAFNILTQGFEIKDVLVYDMLGRVVYQAKDINSNQYQFNSLGANQVLIVKVITGDEQELIKKVN